MTNCPGALYRLQFNQQFPFSSAKPLARYFSSLGITDIYASPVFTARKGSMHGYDITDFSTINPEIGGDVGFYSLACELKSHDIGWIQDMVPNHMAFDPENKYVSDILENGKKSDYFSYFDLFIPGDIGTDNCRILLPILNSYYWSSLEGKEIQLIYQEKGLFISYQNFQIPLLVESYYHFFSYDLSRLENKLGSNSSGFIKIQGIVQSILTLTVLNHSDLRRNQIEFIKNLIWELFLDNHEFNRFVEKNLELFNGKKGMPESFSLLDSLLDKQVFRLSYWKVATEELNYRRFFTINSLISLRMEEDEVFRSTHALLFRLYQEGWISGVRIDHIDGLYDPDSYLFRLRERLPEIYLVIEKILNYTEEIPRHWPVEGTTGYDFLNQVNGLFCYIPHESDFNRIYASFIGNDINYEELIISKKRFILEKHMAGDIENLANLFKNNSERIKEGSDITLFGLRKCLVEVISHLDFYRTYIHNDHISSHDHEAVLSAINKAREKNPDFSYEFNFLEIFILKNPEWLEIEEKEKILKTIMKFQQYTGVAYAKGFEDTALYSYNRLISLNEVGGRPDLFGISTDFFHVCNIRRATFWPNTLNSTGTHDTKRGEDARARINVLSEIPNEWEQTIRTWSLLNKNFKIQADTHTIPSPNDEYFFYQTLIGTIPFEPEKIEDYWTRLKDYLLKAAREAKDHTTWIKPDPEYEEGYSSFLDKVLDTRINDFFLADVIRFSKKIGSYGIFNSLSQTILKITSPGIPDFYQGSETWAFCMVDPDNRRQIDFQKRMDFLDDIILKSSTNCKNVLSELLKTRIDGRIKLYVIYRLLALRKSIPFLFEDSEYYPIKPVGRFADHLIAFARIKKETFIITIVPRFFTGLISETKVPIGINVWKETFLTLPEEYPENWTNVLTGEHVRGKKFPVGRIFKRFPGAVLQNSGSVEIKP